MKIRKSAYALAIVMLSYDSISTLIASALHSGFADLNPLYNLLGQMNPYYVCILMAVEIVAFIIAFLTALSSVERPDPGLSRIGLIILCDFFAVYLLIIGSIAVPHNTMVLFGSHGIVSSQETLHSLKLASVLIAGLVVVIADWRSLFSSANE